MVGQKRLTEVNMRSFIMLSYPLSVTTPAPGGRPALKIEVDETLEMGLPGNTYYYTAWNHAGTHIDAPAHMLSSGKPITAYSFDHFVFEQPVLADVPKQDDQLIVPEDLAPYEATLKNCDLLLLRTSFSRYRKADPVRYRDRSPGLSADVARYLNSNQFPRLRAIGIDTISMAATNHLAEGIQAHKTLFCREDNSAVFLIEDMDLTRDLRTMGSVFVVPLYIEGLDSCPCTVFTEMAGS
jgi:arylformamidase